MKKSFILSVFIFFLYLSNISFSQTPLWLWARGLNVSGSANVYSVAANATGNAYITGYFISPMMIFGSDTLINADTTGFMENVFLTKYDPNGNVLWARGAGGQGYWAFNEGLGVTVDPNGNTYVTGQFSTPTITFGSYTLTNTDSTDLMWNVFLTKYDPDGNVLWARKAEGPPGPVYDNQQIGISVAADADGNAFVVGYFNTPTIIFGPDTLTNSGSFDIFIAKYNPNGTVLWAKSARGPGYDYASSVTVDGSGNAYLTGIFPGKMIIFDADTLKNSDSTGSSDLFFVKYDAGGNVLWVKGALGIGSDAGISVVCDDSGHVYLTGSFNSPTITFGSHTLTTTGYSDIFLVKYDTSGSVIWASSAGGVNDDYAYSVSVDASCDAYVTGNFQSPVMTFGSFTLTDTTSNPNDMFVVIYSTEGNALWATNEEFSTGLGITVDAFENAYLIGGCGPQTVFGSDTCTGPFLAKLEGIAVNINELNRKEGILVYPNPATNKITVKFPEKQSWSIISIVDLEGQQLLQQKISGQITTIDVSALQRGMYFVKVNDNRDLLVRKFIKE